MHQAIISSSRVDQNPCFSQNCRDCSRKAPAGTVLYNEGDACGELYVLLDGWASTSRNQHNGKQLILNFLMPGAFLGFQTDLCMPLHNSVKCITDSVVCVFSRKRFTALMQDNPELALSLTQSAAKDDNAILDNLISIATRPARARVAHLLLNLHTRVIETNSKASSENICIPLTRQHIADALALTNVHVSRAISALHQEKLLSFRKNRLQIHDFEKLSEIANHGH